VIFAILQEVLNIMQFPNGEYFLILTTTLTFCGNWILTRWGKVPSDLNIFIHLITILNNQKIKISTYCQYVKKLSSRNLSTPLPCFQLDNDQIAEEPISRNSFIIARN
jgi:hypothetical protein